jgi:hypothetical protein
MPTILFQEAVKCEICEMFSFQPAQFVLVDKEEDKYICIDCITQYYVREMTRKGKMV